MEHVFQPGEFFGIRVGYRDLFGSASSWADIKSDLSAYTLAEVLEIVGRVSAVLEDSDLRDPDVQARIAFGLFGPEHAPNLLRRAEEIASASRTRRVVLFEPLQLASLAKAALLLQPIDGALRPVEGHIPLGKALLRISDVIGTHFEEFSTPIGRQQWVKFLFATGIFYRGGSELHEIARFHQLCLQQHEDLSSDPDYLDFVDLAASATGLPVHLLWLGLTALTAQCRSRRLG